MANTFHLSVITPERAVLECDATFVAFPAHDGELGVLRNRAPLVCRMGIGALRVESDGGNHTLFVDGGFAQVVENKLTLLTGQAKQIDELDRDSARQAMVEAKAMPMPDDAAYDARQKAMQRAQVQLRLAKK
jgi:F-type H+-transporting ATPase subunit epsilon